MSLLPESSVAISQGATATVHKVDLEGDYQGYTRYYFCCDTCGACGRHWLKHSTALDEAVWHVLNAPQHQEDHNGRTVS